LLNPVVCSLNLPQRQGRITTTFIYLGIMDHRKGAFDLVNAFANIHKNGAPVRLIMAGDGEVDTVRTMVKELGVEEISTIFNWITPEQRDRLLEESDVFVLPSHHEGLPMAMLEAMSWGLPVISTPVGGIPEVIIEGQNGFLIQPGNVDELTQAMHQLVSDTEMCQAMGQNARQTVEPLDIRAYCKELIALYQLVVKRKT
jgi:glycosyltransferase involved in cell wall biosynthesis